MQRLVGFGEKTEAAILAGIEIAVAANQRIRWSDASLIVDQLREHMASAPALNQMEFAGSYRRGRETVGGLDILVNNAGIRIPKPALEVTEEDWDATIDINLKGVFFCAQAAGRHMVAQGYGRIINLGSQLSEVASRGRSSYCASKFGVAGITKVMAVEWAPHGVNVNAIGPGPTSTPGMLAASTRTDEEVQADLDAHLPLGRRMDPSEMVGAVIYLASKSSAGTTGHLLMVDGGWTAI